MSALVIDASLPALVTLAAKATLLMTLAAAAVIFGRRLSAAARHWTPLQEVVRTRDHGVTPEYAREMHALGHKARLAALVKARDHGVTPEKARRANEKAGTR